MKQTLMNYSMFSSEFDTIICSRVCVSKVGVGAWKFQKSMSGIVGLYKNT